jgi:hypothetical protein
MSIEQDFLRLLAAATTLTVWFFPGQPTVDDRAGTAHSLFNSYSFNRAVDDAGATFDTGVQVGNVCLTFFHDKNSVWANRCAKVTTDAAFLVKLQAGNIFNVARSCHLFSLSFLKSRRQPAENTD